MGQDLFLEDIAVGSIWSSDKIAVTADEIKAFGLAYDPQPFHTDEALAAAGPFGSLVASGWHLAAIAMRAFASSKPYGRTPIVGMGVDELRWLKPVKPDDSLSIRRQVLSVERSTRRPDRGTVRSQLEMSNQRGETVMRLIVISQLPARPVAPTESNQIPDKPVNPM